MSLSDAPHRVHTDGMPPWLPRLLRWLVVIWLAMQVGVFVFSQLSSLIINLVLALFLSFALEPAVRFLAKRGWRRGIATVVVFFTLLLFSVGFFAIMLPPVLQEGGNLAAQLTDVVEEYGPQIEETLGLELSLDAVADSVEGLGALVERYAANVTGRVAGVASAFGRFIVNALMVALFTFYLLADGPKLRRRVFSVFPPERQPEVIRIWELAIEKTGGYVYSRLVLAIASGVFTSVALSVIGVRHALALGIWVGVVSQFVPAVGTYIASVVPLFVAFVDDPTKALWVLIVLVAYQQVENLLIAPRVTARTMSLHPAVGFGAAIAGILILGALGAFIALPAAAIIQAFVSAYLDQHPVVANRLIDDDRYEEWTLAAEAEVEAPSQRRSEQAGDDAGNPST